MNFQRKNIQVNILFAFSEGKNEIDNVYFKTRALASRNDSLLFSVQSERTKIETPRLNIQI